MPYYRACCIGSSKYFLQLPAELARTSGAEFGGLRELVLIWYPMSSLQSQVQVMQYSKVASTS